MLEFTHGVIQSMDLDKFEISMPVILLSYILISLTTFNSVYNIKRSLLSLKYFA